MKMSTLVALANNDIVNAIVSETPGGIEAQEARGQRDFVASTALPRDCNGCSREQFEKVGIVFGDTVDDLFIEARLPQGWRKVQTAHSMWSKLVDAQGRERASIFYKAAFYDRSAHIGISRRYSYSVRPVNGYDAQNYKKDEWACVVTDCDATIRELQRIEPEPQTNDRDTWLAWYDKKDKLRSAGRAWLDANYPEWRDPTAYW